MNLGHNFTKLFSIPLTVFVCFFFSIYPLTVLSNETNSNNEEDSNENQLDEQFEELDRPETAPATNRGGSCLVVHNNELINLDFEIIPLMMDNSTRDRPLVTYRSNPTLWFWVKVDTGENLTFPRESLPTGGFNIIQFDSKNDVGNIPTITLQSQSSLVPVRLATSDRLEPERLYQWYFRIRCNPASPDLDIRLNGFIQRELEIPDEREQNSLVDLIDEAIQSVCSDRNNPTLLEEWKKVLKEALIKPENANELVNQPLDCQQES